MRDEFVKNKIGKQIGKEDENRLNTPCNMLIL